MSEEMGQSGGRDVERTRATEVGGGSPGVSKPGLPASAEHLSRFVRSTWEYRVRWRRADSRESTRIYQSHSAAWKKARAVMAVEAVKDDTTFSNMSELVEGPIIEQRPVGVWEALDNQPTAHELSEYEKRSMAQHIEYRYPMPEKAATDAPW